MEIQWPLIIFTTLLAWSAGVFASQCLLALRDGETNEHLCIQMPALIVSFVLMVVGGVSVMFHLQHWERIFNGFGHITSGITQELIAVVVVVVVMVIYFARLRKGVIERPLAIVGIIVAALLAVVMAHSYMMASRPAWDTVIWALYVLGNACAAGPLTVYLIKVLYKPVGTGHAARPQASDSGESADSEACGDVPDEPKDGPSDTSHEGPDDAPAADWLGLPKQMLGGTIVNAAITVAYAIYFALVGGRFTQVGYFYDPTSPTQSITQATNGVSAFDGSTLGLMIAVLVIGAAVPVAAVLLGKKNTKVAVIVALVATVIGAVCMRVAFYQMGISIFMYY